MALTVGTNSYVEVVDATAYFNDSLRKADWAGLSTPTKSAALIEATRYLDRLDWKGEKTSSAQALEFPRDGDSTVPDAIKEATYEVGLRLALDPTLIDNINNQTGSNIKRVKAGDVETEFFGTSANLDGGKQLFDWVHALVKDLLAGQSGGIVGGAIATGTDCESEIESYDKSRGYA